MGASIKLADILLFVERENIRDTVWITADVHYAAAHYFDPSKAAFQDFEPFWEFVAGPLNAGTGRPALRLDGTFGAPGHIHQGRLARQRRRSRPELRHAVLRQCAIDGATGVMTVSLKDMDDNVLWSKALEPVKAWPDGRSSSPGSPSCV